MVAKYNLISEVLSPREVDKILQEKFGANLFRFARAMALALRYSHNTRYFTYTARQISEARKAVLALQQSVIAQIVNIEEKVLPAYSLRKKEALIAEPTKEEVAKLLKRSRAENFLGSYIPDKLDQIEELERSRRLKRGAYINPRALVASAWGDIVLRQRSNIRWALLTDLYFWFWNKLKGFPYYVELKPTSDMDNYLRVQFHRHKKYDLGGRDGLGAGNATAVSHIVDRLDIPGAAVFGASWVGFSLNHVVGSSRTYFGSSWGEHEAALGSKIGLWVKMATWFMVRMPVSLDKNYQDYIQEIIKKKITDQKKPCLSLILFPDESYFIVAP